jgi:hypothetical protein
VGAVTCTQYNHSITIYCKQSFVGRANVLVTIFPETYFRNILTAGVVTGGPNKRYSRLGKHLVVNPKNAWSNTPTNRKLVICFWTHAPALAKCNAARSAVGDRGFTKI